MKMKFRKIMHWLHLWPGIISGLLVVVIAITGSIYAFEKEIQDATQKYRFVTYQSGDTLTFEALGFEAGKLLPGKQLQYIQRTDSNRAVELFFYDQNPYYYYKIYMNPYSGEVIKLKNMEEDFFRWIITGHYYLWLPPHIGKPLVSIATLIFLIVVVSGLIIWIPKSFKGLKTRLWFKWKKKPSFKKANYDLHVVLGFYTSIVALIFGITGLVWGFEWFSKGYFSLAAGINQDLADYLYKNNYDIHTGAIWGITGKTIAMISSLIIAALPITGFIIWLKKKKKKKHHH